MMKIPDAKGVMVQKMLKGTEMFIGAKYEQRFDHVILCGLGGILHFATEIKVIDINPLLADEQDVVAVNARVRITR